MCLVFQTLLISASSSKKNWAQTATGVECSCNTFNFFKILIFYEIFIVVGELAQMVERPLRMREVPGSMPGFSNLITSKIIFFFFV